MMWLFVHGGHSNLLAAAVPVRRPKEAAEFHIVASRPIPAGPGRSIPPAFRFEDDKRPIPSSPDALHNR
jgi:hypothetical protein